MNHVPTNLIAYVVIQQTKLAYFAITLHPQAWFARSNLSWKPPWKRANL